MSYMLLTVINQGQRKEAKIFPSLLSEEKGTSSDRNIHQITFSNCNLKFFERGKNHFNKHVQNVSKTNLTCMFQGYSWDELGRAAKRHRYNNRSKCCY